VILVTATLMLLTFIDVNLSPVRVLFAIGLVTILPGYALTTAIFVNTPLGIMEKIAFSFGFSLGMTSLGGLLLNYSRWGIQSSSWVILLGGVAIVASVITLVRMKYMAGVDLQVARVPFRLNQLFLMILATAIIAGSYVYARAGAENSSLPSATRMWMLWADDSQNGIVLGIENQEKATVQYRLVLSTLQGQIQEWPLIALAPDAVWEIHYETPPSVSEVDFIKATLYRLDSPEDSFRLVYLRRVAR
jgi:uncharacterized membrane protein